MEGPQSHEDLFPILEPDCIVATINRLLPQIQLTLDDLASPQPRKVELLYRLLTMKLFTLDGAAMTMPQFSALDAVKYTEIQENAIPLMNLHMVWSQLMTCGYFNNNVSIKDITAPTPKRTLRILSAIINYWNFYGNRVVTAEEIFTNVHNDSDRLQELTEKKEAFSIKTEELRKMEEERKPRFSILRQEMNDFTISNNAIKSSLDQWDGAVQEYQLLQDTGMLRLDMFKVQHETANVQDKILNSKKREKVNNTQAAAWKRLETDTNVALESLTKLNNAIDEEKKAFADFQFAKSTEANQQLDKNDSDEHHKNALREFNYRYDKLSKMAKKQEAEIASSEQQLDETSTRDKMAVMKQVEEMRHSCKQLEADIRNAAVARTVKEADHDLQISRLQSGFEEFLGQVDRYHNNLAQHWSELRPFYIKD